MKSETKQTEAIPQVVAFPARTPLVGGRQIHFLFSVRQVIDVLKQVEVQRVPADNVDAVDVTHWRGRQVPVLNLEKRLGLRTSESGMPLRNIVVRSVLEGEDGGDSRDLFAVCKVGAAARQFQLPLACRPVVPPEQLPGIAYIEGMYAMEQYLFMVLDLARMADGASCAATTREAAHG